MKRVLKITQHFDASASWLVALVLFTGCNRSATPPPAARAEEKPRPVRIAQARLAPIERTVKSFGSLAAYDQAVLSTKVAGRLDRFSVDLGAVVRQGDVLAQIDPRDYQSHLRQSEALLSQARVRLGLPLQGDDDTIQPEQTSVVRQMRATLDEARANRDRVHNLAEQKILSKSEVETAEAAYEVALNKQEDALQDVRTRQALVAQRRAELEMARQQLEDTTIRAPFDGVVQERRANLGEYLSASAPVVTLVRVDPLRLRLEVSEREAPKIAIDQKVRVTLQGATNVYLGEVKRLSPALDEKSRMLRVEADVPNPNNRLRPGAFVTADIILNRTEQVVVVPEDAIVTFAGMEKVFAAQSGKAVEKSITTGQRMGNLAEVLNGLRAGENVVLEPGNLRNGQAVLINSESTDAGHTNSVAPTGNGGSE